MKYSKAYDFYYVDREDYLQKRRQTSKYKEGRKNWVRNNPEKVSASQKTYFKNRFPDKDDSRLYHRQQRYKQQYGITINDFKSMIEQQNGKCPLCKDVMDWDDPAKRPCMDHNHKLSKGDDGFLRKVLCTQCNLGLGNFRDDSEIMRRSADYIDEHNEKQASLESFFV